MVKIHDEARISSNCEHLEYNIPQLQVMQKSPGLESWEYLIFTYYYYILKYGVKGKYTSLFVTFIETIHVCFFAQKWLILRPGELFKYEQLHLLDNEY